MDVHTPLTTGGHQVSLFSFGLALWIILSDCHYYLTYFCLTVVILSIEDILFLVALCSNILITYKKLYFLNCYCLRELSHVDCLEQNCVFVLPFALAQT